MDRWLIYQPFYKMGQLDQPVRFFVYTLTNRINGKVYVGKTNDPKQRWHAHKSGAKIGSQYVIHRAIRKYGIKNFDFAVVSEHDSEDEAFSAERDLIASLDTKTTGGGYNANAGGRGGYIPSDEVRDKIRKANMGHPVSEATREKIRAARLGSSHTEEAKQKMSLSHKGKPKSSETRAKMSQAQKGHVVSDETRMKLRESCKKNPYRPIVTDELRSRLSNAVKKRWRKWREERGLDK